MEEIPSKQRYFSLCEQANMLKNIGNLTGAIEFLNRAKDVAEQMDMGDYYIFCQQDILELEKQSKK